MIGSLLFHIIKCCIFSFINRNELSKYTGHNGSKQILLFPGNIVDLNCDMPLPTIPTTIHFVQLWRYSKSREFPRSFVCFFRGKINVDISSVISSPKSALANRCRQSVLAFHRVNFFIKFIYFRILTYFHPHCIHHINIYLIAGYVFYLLTLTGSRKIFCVTVLSMKNGWISAH